MLKYKLKFGQVHMRKNIAFIMLENVFLQVNKFRQVSFFNLNRNKIIKFLNINIKFGHSEIKMRREMKSKWG